MTINCWPTLDNFVPFLFDFSCFWLLSFFKLLHFFWFLVLRIQLDTEFVEELLKVMFLDLFFVVFINLRTGLVSDLKFIHLVCNIVADVSDFIVDPSSAQKSIVWGFLIDVNPKSQINSALSDGFWNGFGFAGPNESTERLDFLL